MKNDGLKLATELLLARMCGCPVQHTRTEARMLARRLLTPGERRLLVLLGDPFHRVILDCALRASAGELERVEGQPGMYRDPHGDPNVIHYVGDLVSHRPGRVGVYVRTNNPKETP